MTTSITLQEGDAAPAFTVPVENATPGEHRASLADYAGQSLVLYFYPKDDTSGCTKQAIAFSEMKDAFAAAGASILGVSKDPLAKHAKFRAKHELTIPLASDEEAAMLEAYGVWKEKSMYGRTYMGIERSTFLIRDGVIERVWRKVKVAGHAEAVLETITAA